MIPSIQNITMKRKSRSVSSFLKKTFDLLNDMQNHTVVRWAENGIGFIVVNQDDFAKTVLPKYFKHSNYSSFVRQLNMYNFHKIRETNSESYFRHQSFDRNDKSALAEILRKPQKKKRKNADDDEMSEDEKQLQKQKIVSDKENVNTRSQKSKTTQKVSFQKMSISDIQYSKQPGKNKIQNGQNSTTKQICTSQFTLKMQSPAEACNSYKQIEKDLQIHQQMDDNLSINDEIQQRILQFPTKQLLCPSRYNLFSFGHKGNDNFNVFF